MTHNARFLIPLALLALAVACLPGIQAAPSATPVPTDTVTAPLPTATPVPPTATATQVVSVPAGWSVFTSTLCRYQIGYPLGATESGDDATGCYARFDLPLIDADTNLGEKFLEIYARAGETECKAPSLSAYQPEPPAMREIGGEVFLVEAGGDAGAGNYYDWTAYSTMKDDLCISLMFTLHSTNAMFYDPPIEEYDATAESAIFEEMVKSFTWTTP